MSSPIEIYPKSYQISWRDAANAAAWVDGLIPTTGSTLIFGPAGVGKTTFVCNMLNAIESGQQFLGRNTTPCETMLLSLDTPRPILARRWLTGKPPFKRYFTYVSTSSFNCLAPDFTTTQLYNTLQQEVEEKVDDQGKVIRPKIELVVVDSLRDVFIGQMNNDDLPGPVYQAFQEWFHGASVVFLHHTRKAQIVQGKKVELDPDDEATGSKYWINKAQTSLTLKKLNEKIISIMQGKSQCFEPWDYPIKMELDGAYIHEWTKGRAQQYSTTYQTAFNACQASDPNWNNLGETERDIAIAQHLGMTTRTVRTMKAAFKKMIP